MKTILHSILAIIAVSVILTSCSKKKEADTDAPKRMEFAASSADLPFPKQLADSLSSLYGYLVAYDQLRRVDTLSTEFDKDAFTKGVNIIIADSLSSAGYTQGAQSAISILGQIKEMEAKGIKLNIPLLIKGIRDGLNTDSVTTEQVSQASSVYNHLLVRALNNRPQ